jgi:hypothetical protein
LVHSGVITRQTMVWTRSLPKWSPAEATTLENLFKTAPAAGQASPPLPTIPPTPSTPAPAASAFTIPLAPAESRTRSGYPDRFRPTRLLANCVTALIVAFTIMVAVSIWSETRQLELLERIQAHGPFTQKEALANDARERVLAMVRMLVFITTAIFFGRWIYVAASNVRALGAHRLNFTPGWAVGFYFIPIVSLWKPYQAMKEIWKASANPQNWRGTRTSAIVGWWWGCWIVANVLGQITLRFTRGAGTPDYFASTQIAILFNLAHFPLNIIAIVLVQKISAMQMAAAGGSD